VVRSLVIGQAPALCIPVAVVLLPDSALVLSALINTKGTACESTFDPMSSCKMTGHSTAQPILKATTWTALSLCRACGDAKREHDDGGEHYLPHRYDLS
jgi:hypothetical protein